MLGSRVGVAELAAFFELRSNSCGKSDYETCVSFGTHAHPSSCASRRSQQGWGAGTARLLLSQLRRGSVTRCALPTRGRDRPGEPSAAKDHRPSEAMARVDPVPTPF